MIKDQLKLLKTCLNNDVPAIVFQGDDAAVVDVLEAAIIIYKKKGCSEEFLLDFQSLIEEVKAYQEEFPKKIKVPKLTEYEKELIKSM
ncbi:MAG: hypothetical protein H6Q13_3485 [Bacteroidetes bacterium]|nr:hypothetical protein [Bacteroidota bacterium]